MAEKVHQWFGHSGVVLVAANFSRTYEKWTRTNMPQASHVRIGRFAVVVNKCGLVAAQVFAKNVCDDGSIKPGSKYWEASKRDRLHQCDLVASRLRKEHPLFKELSADIAAERAHYK